MKDGRAPAEPGSHPSGHAASGVDGASRFDPSRESLIERLEAAADRAGYLAENGDVYALHDMNALDKAVCALKRLERELTHVLAHKLETFSNGRGWYSGPADKTNGFAAAKVADWQLRQWLALLRDRDGSGEAGETGTGSTEGNSPAPKGITQ